MESKCYITGIANSSAKKSINNISQTNIEQSEESGGVNYGKIKQSGLQKEMDIHDLIDAHFQQDDAYRHSDPTNNQLSPSQDLLYDSSEKLTNTDEESGLRRSSKVTTDDLNNIL